MSVLVAHETHVVVAGPSRLVGAYLLKRLPNADVKLRSVKIINAERR